MHRWLTALVAPSALLCACSSSDAEPKPREHGAAAPAVTWRFDEPVGTLPTGMGAASGAWSIVANAQAPSAPSVLAQTARGDPMQFHLLLVEREQPADIDLSVSVHDSGGELGRGGGLVWRARDESSYYLARYDPRARDCRIYKVVDGKRQQLASAPIDVASGWHRLRVRAFRESIECSLDGRVVVSARDRTFPGAGRAGLWTESDAQTQFDDLAIGPNL
ncbi:MAG: hypothetical protein ACKVWV_12395 [Planctomycetota bacterium]